MVFGPALVQAYHLEVDVAKYPRVVLPRSVAADGALYGAEGTHWKKCFNGRFIQASDGPFFLHILRDYSCHTQMLSSGKKESSKDDPKLTILKKMRASIQKRLDEASDNPSHFQKVAWFAAYWNTNIKFEMEGLEPIANRPL